VSDPQAQRDELGKRIEKAVADEAVPKIYFNGFINSLGSGDVTLVLTRNGQPVAVADASYTVAKTLAQKLNTLIHDLERDTGNTIMTTDEVNKAIIARRDGTPEGEDDGSV